MNKWIWVGAGAAVALGVLAGCKATRAGYESPAFKLVKRDGKFEIRDYAAFGIVSTPMKGRNPEQDGGFMRLFRYIDGQNERG